MGKNKKDIIRMGADPEVEIMNSYGHVVDADNYVSDPYNDEPFGLDGCPKVAELRPRPGNWNSVYFSLRKIIKQADEEGIRLSKYWNMCVIIINRREIISRNILRQASAYNPDGAGMMWYSNHLNIYKSLNNEKVVKEYYNLRKKFHGTIILHFRFATHGRIDAVNTQPISVNENVAIAHNGIIAGYGNKKFSDTYMFAKDIDVNRLENMEYLQYLQSIINGSRLVIMNKNKIIILNRHLFYELGDSLYSNLYFLSTWNKYC